MEELKIKLPQDIGIEFKDLSGETWQLLFSQFINSKLNEIKEIDNIIEKSKATEEQINELSDEVKSIISKRFLEE